METACQIRAQPIGWMTEIVTIRKTSYQTVMTVLASRLRPRHTACTAYSKLFCCCIRQPGLVPPRTHVPVSRNTLWSTQQIHMKCCLLIVRYFPSEDEISMLPSNVATHIPDCTVSQPRRLQYERSPPLRLHPWTAGGFEHHHTLRRRHICTLQFPAIINTNMANMQSHG